MSNRSPVARARIRTSRTARRHSAVSIACRSLLAGSVVIAGATFFLQPPLASAQAADEAAARLLVQADSIASRQPQRAQSIYQQIIDSEEAPAELKSTARARLLGLRVSRSQDAAMVQTLLDQAMEDVKAGRLVEAEAKASRVRGSGVELGWFDLDRLTTIDQAVDEAGDAAMADAGDAGDVGAAVDPDPAPEVVDPEVDPAPEVDPVPLPEDDTPQPGPADVEDPMPVDPDDLTDETPVAPAGGMNGDLMNRAFQTEVDAKLIAARRALANGQARRAEALADEALALDPDNAQAERILVDAQRQIDDTAGAQVNVIGPAAGDRDVQWQRVKVLYFSAMDRGREQLSEGNYEAAKASAKAAQLHMQGARELATRAEIEQNIDKAVELEQEVIRQERVAMRGAIEDAESETADESERLRRQAIRDQNAAIDRSLRQAWDLRKQRRYDEALKAVNDALYIDPHHIPAQFMKELIEEAKITTDYQELSERQDYYQALASVRNKEAVIPYDDLLTYPIDWPKITVDRLRQLSTEGEEAEANRELAQQLSKVVTVNFEQTPLEAIIDFIRETTGANIAVNWPAMELLGVARDRLITLRLTNVPAEKLLDLILEQASADLGVDESVSWSIIDGIVKIDTGQNLKTATDARVYDIRDLLVEVPNFSNAPSFDLTTALNNTNSGGGGTSGSGGGGGGGGGGSGGLFDEDEEDEEDEGPSRDELIQSITELIQDSVGDPTEWLDEQSTIQELNGNLIIKTTPNNHRDIIGLLAQLRETRAIQISVESRFLIVDQNFLEEFAVDIDASYKGSGKFGPITLAQDTVSLAQRLGSSFAGAPALNPTQAIAGDNASIQAARNASGTGRSLTFGVSFIDDLSVDLLVSATLAHSKSTSLNAPRVTFFNGQRAFVTVARQIAFVSDLEPIPDSVGFDPTISVVSEGVVLDVQGTISADRRYVTLTVRPSLATVDQPIETFQIQGSQDPVIDPITGEIIQQGSAAGFIQVPEVSITSVRATVSVPDRGTLLLGGQRVVTEGEVEAGVPVLSKLPILNRLFTNTSNVKEERTLLILIKPTIIIQSEQEDALYPGLNDDPDAYVSGR